jgi:rhodanese-related sulfurtransferase
MASEIDARTLKDWLGSSDEIALMDVREPGRFSEAHLFFAIPVAYSRFELDIERLVPRKTVRLVLCDDDESGVAGMAARRAEALGYSNVHTLAGGAKGWADAGYTLYSGVNVPSKTFGELVEHARETPHITAQELNDMRRRGDKVVVVDGRSLAEHRRFTIPGSICCPNGELPLRIAEIVPDPETPIVVNCAGRTRSIIGAEILRSFGVTNPISALENGTQGWRLIDLELEHGADRPYPQAPDGEALVGLRARASELAERHGATVIEDDALAGWLADENRTTFLVDVRTHEEFASGSLTGAVHAPGGQLVQATDAWVGIRGARIVVVDSEGVRAPVIAAWLRQLGHEAHVLRDGVGAKAGIHAAEATVMPQLPELPADELKERLADVRVLDMRASADYREGHVAGSLWAMRPTIAAAAGDGSVVLVADDPQISALAAIDLAAAGCHDVSLLAGGLAAWQAAGGAVEASPDVPPDSERVDYIFHTHTRHLGDKDAMRAYLSWEIELVNQLDDQERNSFRL